VSLHLCTERDMRAGCAATDPSRFIVTDDKEGPNSVFQQNIADVSSRPPEFAAGLLGGH
jgi:hypothetical protein